MNKPLDQFSELELAEAINQVWSQLTQAQGNLQALNAEIAKRKTVKPQEIPKVEKLAKE